MKLVVLTTETLHHCYFVRELIASFPIELVVLEHEHPVPPFEIHHAFEDDRDAHERATLFDNRRVTIDDFAETLKVRSACDAESLNRLLRIRPDAMVVFGTSKLSAEVIEVCAEAIVNLHGGDPQHYRGLDSHLWAIYHGDYERLKVTLHRVNERFDAGAIVLQQALPLRRGMKLHELRRVNTEVCLTLVRSALECYARDGRLNSRTQSRAGRYYSFMPGVLKDVCKAKFEAHTRDL